jgi:hypothetical protein
MILAGPGKETKFTLSCSFKTTAGQGEKVDAPAVWPRSQARGTQGLCGEGLCPAQGGGYSTRAHCPRLGTLPSLEDTGDHDKNSSIIFLLSGIVTKLFTPPAPHPHRETSEQSL